jgi:methyltransferase (TIGR00027 family)
MTELVRNVSDTARWVATYRARESARKDAHFSDPFADRMAGERGRAIAKTAAPHSEWAIITRTKLIDDVVRDLLAEGTDTILNLAAGFDTRPYRLALPEQLRWVEADLPELIAEKEQLLAGEKPRCRLERVAVDLSDAGARVAFLDRYSEGARRAAVISEGLVIYLDPKAVAELGRALLACPRLQSWVLDFYSPRTQAEISNSMRDALTNAPFKFAPPNGLAFFEALGWKTRIARSLFREGTRLKRVPLLMRPFALLPEPNPRDLKNGRWSAVVRFDRA